MIRLTLRMVESRAARLCELWMARAMIYADRAKKARAAKDMDKARAYGAVAHVFGDCAKALATVVIMPALKGTARQPKSKRSSKS